MTQHPADGWTGWTELAELPAVTPAVLVETLDGGQAFRWYALAEGEWIGAWSDHVARLRQGKTGVLQWSAPASIARRVGHALPSYLAATGDFQSCVDALPWRSDPHLAACLTAFPGLRILRQPFGETLLCFLCSATKQIVQIKQMVALLAERHGEKICEATALETPHLRHLTYALPTWEKLATIPEAELRKCLLGFRAKYIAQTAEFLAAHRRWLDETETLPYAQAKERLCSLPGVGEKVADCVLLFGAGKLEAFPVDVWILKTMARRYGLEDWKPAQLAQFGRAHFGAYAGLAQQFLFAWERQVGRASARLTNAKMAG